MDILIFLLLILGVGYVFARIVLSKKDIVEDVVAKEDAKPNDSVYRVLRITGVGLLLGIILAFIYPFPMNFIIDHYGLNGIGPGKTCIGLECYAIAFISTLIFWPIFFFIFSIILL